jgi:RNA polymerase sigma-70 factor, ECF subfamily
MTETDLLLQLRSGNKEAFAELVKAYRKKVLNICYRFLLNREDAEDVSQEVFIEVYHSIKRFRGDSKLGTWIYRIAVTRSLDEIKKQKRQKRISSLGRTLGIEQITNWVSGNDRPDRAMEDKEGYSVLLKALNKLSDNQRIALTLSKIEGYSNTEVAEILQTSLTAVDSLIYRARKNLLTSLQNKSPE